MCNLIIKIGQLLGLFPTDDERKTLESLAKYGQPSMRVIGRGRLVMSVEDAKKAASYKKLVAIADEIIDK